MSTAVINEVVWAEISGYFPGEAATREALASLGVNYNRLEENAALAAGRAWKAYRLAGGTRKRMIADFLIGAHAVTQADRLLTRDRGFYRTYFKHLKILDPSAA